jgi:hypothetical protein
MQARHISSYRFRRPKKEIKERKSLIQRTYPYVIPSLIFLGIARLSFYYARFNVNILLYLDFSEILTSFFDFIIVLAVSSSIFVTIVSISTALEGKKKNEFLEILFFLISFGLGIALLYLIQHEIATDYILIIFGFSVAWMLIVVLYTTRVGDARTNEMGYKIFLFFFTLTSFIMAIWMATWLDTRSIKVYKRYLGVKIVYNDTTKSLISDSTTYYIGNTSNYLFVYNQRDDVTTVQKMDNVKTIEFPRRNPDSNIWNQ